MSSFSLSIGCVFFRNSASRYRITNGCRCVTHFNMECAVSRTSVKLFCMRTSWCVFDPLAPLVFRFHDFCQFRCCLCQKAAVSQRRLVKDFLGPMTSEHHDLPDYVGHRLTFLGVQAGLSLRKIPGWDAWRWTRPLVSFIRGPWL